MWKLGNIIALKKGIYYITPDLWPSKQNPDTDSIEGLNIQFNFQDTPQLSLFGFKLFTTEWKVEDQF